VIEVDLYQRIRYLYTVQRRSQQAIAQELGISPTDCRLRSGSAQGLLLRSPSPAHVAGQLTVDPPSLAP